MLALLSAADAVPMGELLVELDEEKSTLTRKVDLLERLGLAARMPDPRDSRARLVALTADGRDRYLRLREQTAARWRERLADWETQDVEALTALLQRLLSDTRNSGN
jgi:DNA-binding MarR family transcriptional regulator